MKNKNFYKYDKNCHIKCSRITIGENNGKKQDY